MKWLMRLLLTILVLVVAGSFAWQWGWQQLNKPLALQNDNQVYTLRPGSSLNQVAKDVERLGLMQHARLLLLYNRWKHPNATIKAGEYQLSPGLTPLQLLQMMQEGKVVEYRVTLVEGHSFKDFLRILHEQEKLASVLDGMTPAAVMQKLGHEGQHPEGRFFPDTYVYHSSMSDADVLSQAYDRMQKVLSEEWKQRADGLPYRNSYEALIMASIVEKETGVPEERDKIAGVFVRRLEKGMRLQTDPTVIYGLGDSYDGNITKADLNSPTPYNTYTIVGLPPTPIAMPGAAAIHAALHPAEGTALYFVATGNGGHTFSDSLQEHNQAVSQYLKVLKNRPKAEDKSK
ncbi:endolytic transglycosylase MltG [Pokkaliibacter sp. MBI-7]|uniref:endolytic transglycosylase MltG n=1 Tax=Pokkaliibacter sp. MBI-7 TaxID=3040600 RepID=UPI00244AB28B|nr:endolytic transglycosylase MltG [Pokkaliibacter sp. MBI-7]MDH2435199.1 endolytic transglycosylase MltG [Pokkaliibacter sp. MBI-7]